MKREYDFSKGVRAKFYREGAEVRLPIDEHLEELLQTVLETRADFDIWWVYASEEYESEYRDVFDTYSEFFGVGRHAHFVAMVIGLYRLYDRRADSISIYTLLQEAKNDSGFSTTVVDEAESKLQAVVPVWEKVKTLRHKLFAHRDKQLKSNTVFKDLSFTPNDLRSLMENSLDLLNGLLYYKQKTTYEFWPYTIQDTLELLDALQSHLRDSGSRSD